MSQFGRIREFVNRNLVSIVMVPSIIALHWGWLKLQDVEVLVSPEEKRNLPIIEVMHSYVWPSIFSSSHLFEFQRKQNLDFRTIMHIFTLITN